MTNQDNTNGKKTIEETEAEKKHAIFVKGLWETIMKMQSRNNELIQENSRLRKLLGYTPHAESNLMLADIPSPNSPSNKRENSNYALVARKKPKSSHASKERIEPSWGWIEEEELVPNTPYSPDEEVPSEEDDPEEYEELEQTKVSSKGSPSNRRVRLTTDGWIEYPNTHPEAKLMYNSEEEQPDEKDDPDYTPGDF